VEPVPSAPQTASVVIPSFNYGRFIGDAIESALRQSRPPRDVIVVDDGSTDDSRAVISGFGNRIQAVFKENGGFGSAINAGCRRAEGDVVFLLDADDELRPEAVATVLGAWQPDTVMVHCRPGLMDAQGRDVPGTVPAPWIRLDEGDVRPRLLATGTFSTTVTSGLALRRDTLLRVLPIPEDRFRQGADGFLVRAIAFLGPVQAVDRPLARYRRHGENDSEIGPSREQLAAGFRKKITFLRNEFEAVKELAREHGLSAREDLGEHDPDYLFLRLCSLAVDRAGHPLPDKSRMRLATRFLASQWRLQSPAGRRLAMAGLASALAVLPHPLRPPLLAWWYVPAARPAWLSRFASRGRHPGPASASG
jgi:glycosyltransferase involved in cell wall biosynthesis